MTDFVSFTVKDIDKIGLVCLTCKSELVISSTKNEKEPIAPPHMCPACLAQQKPFTGYKDGWFERIQHLRNAEEAGSIRLYFTKRG
jgi:hypothetical protein